ncbi:hypothetical protein DNK06_08865 [Pseudomonas daroniae]|uniref:Uncharacterized protein n=1 Tax=Phytopseudomonas daroniae TaxID=2487519 RepID=A0A4Q9QPD8_9GAMM|nr:MULTISPECIES: hypothetical protein [Pseudomonas]TBU81210.1 hypothetical protein DNK06_08865 [Pseudomonas daroniae]TBU83734.1 hypothetical protein DNK31_09630 [Pseudomonas sp. FRB 228]TBU89332.1 hypothetical protein DNJ99_16490 [Pseudomonas daroniae]
MAGKSLGILTLDLIARVGAFEQGMDKAERSAKKSAKGIKDSADQASAAWTGLGKIAAGALAGLSVGTVFSTVINNTRQMEQEQAQLAAVLKSTGEAAGFSRDHPPIGAWHCNETGQATDIRPSSRSDGEASPFEE